MSKETKLCFAVQKGEIDAVAQLLPYCNARQEFRAIPKAITLGFFEIADLILATGQFRFARDEANTLSEHFDSLLTSPEDLSHWHRFTYKRSDRLAALDPIYLEYLLVLAAQAGERQVHMIGMLLQKGNVDVNCRLRVRGRFRTPLTASAEQGSLCVISCLLKQPGIDTAVCGDYDWPPFFHLLRSAHSISAPEGLCLLNALSTGPLIHKTKVYNSKDPGPFETIFTNILRSSSEDIMHSVIVIVRGAAGGEILPLLVRTHDKRGIEWVLCFQNARKSAMQVSWGLICDYIHHNDDTEAFDLIIQVAEAYIQWGYWEPAISKCLHTQNFLFAKQFFFDAHDEALGQLTSDTLQAFKKAAADDELIEAWNKTGYANTALWNAFNSETWQDNPLFKSMLSDARIDPNLGDPHPRRPMKSAKIDHDFIREACSPRNPKHQPSVSSTGNDNLQEYNMQLIMIEQQIIKHMNMARAEALGRNLLGEKSLLMWAAEWGNSEMVNALLKNPRINVNAQGYHDQTALMYAIARGDEDIMASLLGHKDIRVDLVDDQRRSSLFYAVKGGHEDIVQILLDTHEFYLAIKDNAGRTVMNYAQEAGDLEMISVLEGRM
ncbi:hypothetical protein MMC09_004936 [Bachmanniomyces sp. S44760]|nr:hypothetical protein [Bachmanniomyces sp. S44760]